ncbi:MAG: hydroxymethylpyrimidine/phosphomethylpyrimidine kinase [Gammaproteobacteria bacterium]|nr:hydroxymethylpyrimidine/phosphomethylpyrimidine kinase [Gammaproteobacteria bacterium]MBU6510432.1 hydroxymethylpyrimidine/phosphomethylpyrimidine kinase [Gammaproteobacteria bacterium]MDE1984018.1 hydroxymethylpyrimidine/phosphomethylpyrimidine kinase [Gammaproteobacteria bacterium]MDE2108544.1 hydroxymethylpyrimidine/phosphomethylpyrimidine kinase [Gammaproteobacteria bacterium]MDE2460478.1 hydroxymethylpyrimidine/phosphomethylpyrimidine kinase [Gammaproteobacteria bacterium]
MRASIQPPVVLVIAGNDPSGGAGLAADMQAITALAAHPAPVVTALTVQDTVNAYQVEAVAAELVRAQAETVLQDMPVAAIKLGLLANAAIGQSVAALLRQHRNIPVVLDPVLVAAGGAPLAEQALVAVYLEQLLPLATVVTPNAVESRRLAPQAEAAAGRAAELLARGAQHVLVKGADENTPDVQNTLFGRDGRPREFTWPRLPGNYHGSGCTLASAIAALIARGYAVPEAVEQAQAYTWKTLQQGWRLGKGQTIPNRRAMP